MTRKKSSETISRIIIWSENYKTNNSRHWYSYFINRMTSILYLFIQKKKTTGIIGNIDIMIMNNCLYEYKKIGVARLLTKLLFWFDIDLYSFLERVKIIFLRHKYIFKLGKGAEGYFCLGPPSSFCSNPTPFHGVSAWCSGC